MTDFPFHSQETSWACGAAVMRMALEKLGIKKSERQIVRILKTNKIRGTWHREFPRVAEKLKFDYCVKRNATLEDLQEYQNQGYIVIVCYYLPREHVDHYSIVRCIDAEHISFYDPWFGPEHRYTLGYFHTVWKSLGYENEKCWFFAVHDSNPEEKRDITSFTDLLPFFISRLF